MNIFYIDKNAVTAAQSMVDSHVVKMTLETCQLMSTAHRVLDGSIIKYPRLVKGSFPARFRTVTEYTLPDHKMNITLYKPTHVNHPSAVWCRASHNNYQWMFRHLFALLGEYSFRYGKQHKCARLLSVLSHSPNNIPHVPFTQPPCVMPLEYIISTDAVENYRNFYKYGKAHLHKYTNTTPPTWLQTT